MEHNGLLLPVPVVIEKEGLGLKKKERVTVNFFFCCVFALYLLSTLLGAALVPGKVELDSFAFRSSVRDNFVLALCTERCFFALFSVLLCFTAFKFPVLICSDICLGIFSGITTRLLLYGDTYLNSLCVAFLLALIIVADIVFLFVCSILTDFRQRFSRFKKVLLCFFLPIFYISISVFLTFLLSKMFK